MSPKKQHTQTKRREQIARVEERQQLRTQLREAGWVVGQKIETPIGTTIELWPVPHTPETAAAAGIEPRRVHGNNFRDAMRRALQPGAEHDPTG